MKIIKPPEIEEISLEYHARSPEEAVFLANAVNDFPAEIYLVDPETKMNDPSIRIKGGPEGIAIANDDYRLNCSFEDDVTIIDESGLGYFIKHNDIDYTIIRIPLISMKPFFEKVIKHNMKK